MFLGLFVLACIALALFCIFDVNLADPSAVRRRSQATWSGVVLIPVVGALSWFATGRPTRAGAMPGSTRPVPPRLPTRPSARGPEDDPAFMRTLAERLRDRDDT